MTAVRVAVIIPTVARPERAASLLRAVDSVVSQQGARGLPVVVTNGPRRDPALMADLARRRDIRLLMQDAADLRGALRAGRASVDTPYFAVLDDDDELLPEALSTRVAAMEADPPADVVVTSGIFEGFGRRQVNIEDFGRIEADPLRALFIQHWLPPCAGLYRTDAIGFELFARMPAYLEWTYMALCIAHTRRIRFLGRPTFCYRTDTPGSLSKSKAYCLAGPGATASLLQLELPRDVRAMLRRRLTASLHSASEWELRDGNHAASWSWHLKCVARLGGWRYLPYTRHLLADSVRAVATAIRSALPT